MTDFFKDVFEAAQQRIRSPFIGSVIVAFIAVNWQALFYLFFEDASVLARIDCFNDMTSNASLYWLPLSIGAIMAVVLPVLRFVFASIVKFPERWLRSLQDEEANSREIEKLKLARDKVVIEADLAVARAEEQSRILAIEERRTIDAAKRDVEVQDEFDPEIAERLQKQIDELRERPATIVAGQGRVSDNSSSSESRIATKLDILSRTIIFTLGNSKDGWENLVELPEKNSFRRLLLVNSYPHSGSRLREEYDFAVAELKRLDAIAETAREIGDRFVLGAKLTATGYKLFDSVATNPDWNS